MWAVTHVQRKRLSAKKKDPETEYAVGHELVWNNIHGAMNAAMLYVGDHLKLYDELKRLCAKDNAYTTAVELAETTGLNQRWLREWLAQQAAMGVLTLLPGSGDSDEELHYRLPAATAQVLADPSSKEYDISMIQMVPALVHRAKTMVPEAFRHGVGRPYDEPDVAEAIDRHHSRHIKYVFMPKVLGQCVPEIQQQLEAGIKVADLGCGAANMLVALAKAFPKSTFHGFEISTVALEKAAYNIAAAKLKNVFLHDCNIVSENLNQHKGEFDLCVVFDVLHDSTHPLDLVKQVKAGLKPETGRWLLADIPAAESTRANLTQLAAPATYYAFSSCLCMSCALSVEGGAGLGTLGFSVPVAKKMLAEGGFENVKVLMEEDNARWFLVH